MKVQTYRYLPEIREGARVAIYGKGERGCDLVRTFAYFRPDLKVVFFVDSFERGEKDGIEVLLPEDLTGARKGDFDLIVIASVFSDQIIDSLSPELAAVTGVATGPLCQLSKQATGEIPLYHDGEFCQHHISPRANHHMDFEFFKDVVQQAKDCNLTDQISLGMLGEPLLYPHFMDAISYCKDLGFKVGTITNGLALTPKRYLEMCNRGIDFVQHSLHNFTPESFRYRQAKNNMDYARFRRQLLDCLDAHIANGIETKFKIVLSFMKEEDPVTRLWGFEGTRRETLDHQEHFDLLCREISEIADRHDYEICIDNDEYNEFFTNIEELHRCVVEMNISQTVSLLLTPIFQEIRPVMEELRPEGIRDYEFVPCQRTDTCHGASAGTITWDGHFFACGGPPHVAADFAKTCIGRVTPDYPLGKLLETDKFREQHHNILRGLLPSEYCLQCNGYYRRKE